LPESIAEDGQYYRFRILKMEFFPGGAARNGKPLALNDSTTSEKSNNSAKRAGTRMFLVAQDEAGLAR
jgi:hypothetical protein